MGVYEEALKWANDRGDSGGAVRMRKALMSLYNWWWQFPIGEALANLDANGKKLLFACMDEYARVGETEELQEVGARIRASGMLDSWRELLEASHEAQAGVRRGWEYEQEQQARKNAG